MNTFKYRTLMSVFTFMLIAGCEGGVKSTKGTPKYKYNKVCIEGVFYYESIKRLAPAFNVDGSLQLCGT